MVKSENCPFKSRGVIKSTERTFEIIKIFADSMRGLTATDVGRALGYPPSSTDSLLKSMVRLGYLRRAKRGAPYIIADPLRDLARQLLKE